MKLPALALRNVLRNRRRTLITLSAIGVAAAAIVMLGGYVSATIKGLQTMTVRSTGHLQIMADGYLAFGRAAPARYAIRDDEALIAMLQHDPVLAPMLRVVTPVLEVQGVAGHFASGHSSTFAAAGWQPEARDTLLSWNGLAIDMPAQRSPLRSDRPEQGVIGAGLAQLLGLCDALAVDGCAPRTDDLDPEPGGANGAAIAADLAELGQRTRERSLAETGAFDLDPSGASVGPGATDPHGDTQLNADGVPPPVAIELLAASSGGAPNVIRLQVAEAQRQGVRELDLMHVSLPLELAQRLVFGRNGTGASAVVVQLHAPHQLEPARARITELLAAWPGQALEVRDFGDVQPSYGQIVAMFSTMFGFVSLLMLVVTLFSVANTVNMAVSERTGEIGTLRAIGLRRREIRRMFVAEGGLLGLIGGSLGVAFALVVSSWGINRAGLSWTPPSNTVPVPISIDVAGSLQLCLITIALMTVIACVSSWLPARRAARLQIVEALRHV